MSSEMFKHFIEKHFDKLFIATFVFLFLLGAGIFILGGDPSKPETIYLTSLDRNQPFIFLIQFCMVLTVPLVLVAGGWWYYQRQTSYKPSTDYSTSLDPREAEQNPRVAPLIINPLKPHAIEAMRAAGLEPETNLNALPLDLGLIAFWSEHVAYIHRTTAIPVTAISLQPYVQLELRQEGLWTIEFEILDSSGKTVFQETVRRELTLPQRLLITPPARLSLHNLAHDGDWTLRLHVNDKLLASHVFSWRSDTIDNVSGSIESDGEIGDDILSLLADNYAQPLSLDNLLAERDYQSGKPQ
jgi:hypothetical protein